MTIGDEKMPELPKPAPRAAPQVEMVSDEMVGAAVNSLYAGFAGERITLPPIEIVRLIARHAIQAALNARAGGDDSARLDWLAHHGISFRQDYREPQHWYMVAVYHTGIPCIDSHHRFPTTRAAIDAALASQAVGVK